MKVCMKNVLLLHAAVALFANGVQGQGIEGNGFKVNNYFDLALSGAKDQFSTALAWSHLHGVGKKKKIQFGYGVRFTSFAAANRYYTTAPSKYTSTVQNL